MTIFAFFLGVLLAGPMWMWFGMSRGAGNAIVPVLAAEFIAAFMESEKEPSDPGISCRTITCLSVQEITKSRCFQCSEDKVERKNKTIRVDGKNIKADVFYMLKNGKLVEVK